ncbi:MAG: SusD/RagB family nutrient-binding outer membrane lipoprotein [Bacteroidota bacterium]
MRNIFIGLMIFLGLTMSSCTGILDGVNDNPNELTPDDVNPEFFLTGAQLANTLAQCGHLNRISGLWSGQLTGFTSLYSNIYGYSISTAESVDEWSHVYVATVTNVRLIRDKAVGDNLLIGIAKVMEAHAVGTMAILMGDVPYSQIGDFDIPDPVFDSQRSVLTAMIALLEDGITDLDNAVSRDLPQDIHFEGDATMWKAAAYTLIARYYLIMKDYGSAYTAAQNGIADGGSSMKYFPRGDASITEGDKNLFWTILEGSRTGDIGTGDSYMMQLLDSGNGNYRGNAKTDETARFGYFKVDESGGAANTGVIEQFEPHNMVTYAENQLILAECGARTQSFAVGLGHLNDLRAWLNTGEFLNANWNTEPFSYEAYEDADFMNGGMENADNMDMTRALLREIVEERYISGFGMYMAFNDARRLRKSDGDISVPFPLNPSSATQHPERMPYSDDELNSNSNAPTDDPGIYSVTEVNQ